MVSRMVLLSPIARSESPRAGRNGFSLIEVMTTLAVASLLLATAWPAMSHLVAQSRASLALNQMLGAVQLTRHVAVTHRTRATLCSSQGPTCKGRDHWHEGAMIFLDRNADRIRQTSETIVRSFPAIDSGKVTWRSFRRRATLTVLPSGYTDWQNGSFRYCPANGDLRYARQIIINAQGRARKANDNDGDGIVEGADGAPIRCG